jgi:HSP20 family protein
MALIPWRSKKQDSGGRQLSLLGDFRGEMDRLFDSFLRDAWSVAESPGAAARSLSMWAPELDVEETDKEVRIRAEIPGVKPEDLQISIQGDVLVIAGEKKEAQEREAGGYHYQERRFGSFRRAVTLPAPVDPDDVKAEYKDGILTIELKKSQEAMPKRIPVKAS